jgi:hypothetical protein
LSFIEKLLAGEPGLVEMIKSKCPAPALAKAARERRAELTARCAQLLRKGASLGGPGLCLSVGESSPDPVNDNAEMPRTSIEIQDIQEIVSMSHYLEERAVDISIEGLTVYPGM